MSQQAWEWVKLILPLLFSGVIGAIITALVATQRNKIQPIKRKIIAAYVDLPKAIQGYGGAISLQGNSDQQPQFYYFQQLAIIQVEILNSSNKDFEKFDFGIAIPDKIIGVQYQSDDNMHIATHTPEVTILNPAEYIKFELKPFNRKDRYILTTVVNTADRNLMEKVSLSKVAPIRFIDLESKNKNEYDLYTAIGSATVGLLIGLFSLMFQLKGIFDIKDKVILFLSITTLSFFLVRLFRNKRNK